MRLCKTWAEVLVYGSFVARNKSTMSCFHKNKASSYALHTRRSLIR
jgi:hypothetical protein